MSTVQGTIEANAEDWKSSNAKKLFKQDIRDGKVTRTMKLKQVYAMHDEYKAYKYENFRANLLALKKKIQGNQDRARDDALALEQDLNLYPRAENTSRGYPHWDTSAANRRLKRDFDRGLIDTMTPKQLWRSHEAYQVFSYKLFRKHIGQELRKREQSSYWSYIAHMNREKKSKKKKSNKRT